jgi:hypothetical protein
MVEAHRSRPIQQDGTRGDRQGRHQQARPCILRVAAQVIGRLLLKTFNGDTSLLLVANHLDSPLLPLVLPDGVRGTSPGVISSQSATPCRSDHHRVLVPVSSFLLRSFVTLWILFASASRTITGWTDVPYSCKTRVAAAVPCRRLFAHQSLAANFMEQAPPVIPPLESAAHSNPKVLAQPRNRNSRSPNRRNKAEKDGRPSATSPTRLLAACWNRKQTTMEASVDARPPPAAPEGSAADPKHPVHHPPHQQNQLLRNVISALSFESVFRRNQSSSASSSAASSSAPAAAVSSCPTHGTNGTANANDVVRDASTHEDACNTSAEANWLTQKMADLVPPSASRRWSRSDPQQLAQAQRRQSSSVVHVHASNMLHGTLDPDGGVEVVFYDCHEYGDGPNSNEFQPLDFRRDSVVMSSIRLRGGAAANLFSADDDESIEMRHGSPASYQQQQQQQPHTYRHREGAWRNEDNEDGNDNSQHIDESDQHTVMSASSASSSLRRFLPTALTDSFTAMRSPSSKLHAHPGSPTSPPPLMPCGHYPPPPHPPAELPLRFLRAGKGDPEVGLKRYMATLAWRRENRMDGILREPCPHFELIKKHYPHFFAGRGRLGEPVFYEQPPKTNLKALKEGGVNIDVLMRHVRVLLFVIALGRSARIPCVTSTHSFFECVAAAPAPCST